MDHRDVASHFKTILFDVDLRSMTGKFLDQDDEGNEVERTVHLKFEVCETCDGRGRHVNPSIDSHGLTAEDFYDDPDFAEDYFSGRYDVACHECHGERVTPELDEDRTDKEIAKRYLELVQDAWDYAREVTQKRELGY